MKLVQFVTKAEATAVILGTIVIVAFFIMWWFELTAE